MISEAQAALRKSGIGASEIAAVCGVDPYRSALDVWLVKTGRKPGFAGNAKTRQGQALEGPVLDMYHEDTGHVFYRPNHGAPADSADAGFHRAENGIQLCNLDAWDENSVIEVKVSDAVGWGIDGTDEIPDSYALQVQQQMFCARRETATVVRYSTEQDRLYVYHVHADSVLQQDMEAQALAFWQFVHTDTPPPSDDGKGLGLAFGVRPDSEVVISESLAREYHEAKEAEKAAELRKSKALAEIEKAMGGAERAKAGAFRIKRTLVAGRESVSMDALREKYPEVWKALAFRSASFPRMTVTAPKEGKQ